MALSPTVHPAADSSCGGDSLDVLVQEILGFAMTDAGGALQLSGEERSRYARHISLPEVGVEGQQRLKAASVLCIGAGGLGLRHCCSIWQLQALVASALSMMTL